MKIFKKISLGLSLFAIFFMNSTNVFAGTAAATNYINTVYSMHLCETGSSATSCKNPLVIRLTPTGTTMNIGSVNAGESAGGYGNLNVLKAGTTYTYGQVVLDRTFTLAGSDGSCQTSTTAAAGTANAFAVGEEGTSTSDQQVVYINDGSGFPSNMNTTDWKDATTTGDADAGVSQTGQNYIKFRWELAAPYTHDGGRIPSMKIQFDLSSAITFSGTCGGAAGFVHGIYPTAPSITNLIY